CRAGAAGVEARLRADHREDLRAALGVGLLVRARVGAAVVGDELELAAADVAGRVEVGDVGADRVLAGLEQTRHGAGDVGGVADHDLGVGDAGSVLEPVAAPALAVTRGRVLAVALGPATTAGVPAASGGPAGAPGGPAGRATGG